jgi:hypothetical protein
LIEESPPSLPLPYDRLKALWPDDRPTVSNIVPSVKPERSYESYRFIQAVEAPENLDISLPNDTCGGGGAFDWYVRAFHLTLSVLRLGLTSFGMMAHRRAPQDRRAALRLVERTHTMIDRFI